jgi:hypothetical protein
MEKLCYVQKQELHEKIQFWKSSISFMQLKSFNSQF